MSYSAIGLDATSSIINNKGLSVNPSLTSTLSSYNSISTVSLASSMFATASGVPDTGQLTTALKSLGSTGAVLFGVAPGTGVPNFTSNISTQANAPFANGVAGFANVIMQVMPVIMQAYDIAGSSQLVKNKTYEMSGPGYKNKTDLVTAGIGTLAPVLSRAVAGFGNMYDITNLQMFSDPYVFTNNLLKLGLGKIGGLSSKLSEVGLTQSNILMPPTDVGGSSPEVVVNILSQIQGQDLADIISATGFVSANSNGIISLADFLNIEKVTTKDISNVLINNDINTLADLSYYLYSKIGSGTFNSFADLSSVLASIIVPTLVADTSGPTTPVISTTSLSGLSTLTGTGPFNNPTLPDILGCSAGIPYSSNFANIVTILNSTPGVSTVLTNLGQVYTAINTYVSGGTYNSTTLAPVVTAIQNTNSNVTSLMTSSKIGTANNLYSSCYTHYTNELSLITNSGILITNPATTPSRLSDLARTITSIGTDPSQFGLVQFFTAVSASNADGDCVRATIAENYNAQLLQNKGITFNNTVQPTQKLAQAQKFGISITQLQQLVK